MTQKRTLKRSLAYAWICSLTFQYGFSISALNSLYDALNCHSLNDAGNGVLPACFSMTGYRFGLLSSIYTIGGLLGSLVAGSIADAKGRKSACILGGTAVGSGAIIMSLAPNFFLLVAGRAIVGVGCGIAVVLVPTYLSEMAPPEGKGSIGVLNQLSIVIGILCGQCASLGLARIKAWRYVMVISAIVAALQLLLSANMPESPVWLRSQGKADNTSESEDSLPSPEARRLLGENTAEPTSETAGQAPTTMWAVLRSPATRKGIRIVLITQVAQQASGINAVLYYSTDIMKTALPTAAGYIALLITVVNLIMTFPPLYLIDRVGRRPLLLTSIACMSLSALLLSFTISAHPILASIFIVLFVSSFSIGLGPIPFVLLPEVVPPASAAATGSLGLSVNWITNFAVGLSFPILQAKLGAQTVFVIFAGIAALFTILISIVV